MAFEGAILPEYFNMDSFSFKQTVPIQYHSELGHHVIQIDDLRHIYRTNQDRFYTLRDELYLRDAQFILSKPSPIFPKYGDFHLLVKGDEVDKDAYQMIDFKIYGIQDEMERFLIQDSYFYNGINIEGFKIFGLNNDQLRSLFNQFIHLGFKVINPYKKSSKTKENKQAKAVVITSPQKPSIALSADDQQVKTVIDEWLTNYEFAPLYQIYDDLRSDEVGYSLLSEFTYKDFVNQVSHYYQSSEYMISDDLLVKQGRQLTAVEYYLMMNPGETIYEISTLNSTLERWKISVDDIQNALLKLDHQDKIWLINTNQFIFPESIHLTTDDQVAIQKLLHSLATNHQNILLKNLSKRHSRRLPQLDEGIEWSPALMAHIAKKYLGYELSLFLPFEAMATVILSTEPKDYAQILREEIQLEEDLSERELMDYLTDKRLFNIQGSLRKLPEWLINKGEIKVTDSVIRASEFNND